MFEKIKKEIKELEVLFRNLPSLVVSLFFIAIICMNLLANKTIVNVNYLALDGGLFLGWITFLSMDVITQRFGPKASTSVSIVGLILNVFIVLVFKIVSLIPTQDDYTVFNSIFGGTWFILLGSTIAMICSSFINNFLNYFIGKLFVKNKGNKLEYVCRSYISTFIGQFFDNLIFAIIVFMIFAPIFWDGFSWTFVQSVSCSLVGAFVELSSQILFSPIGYKILKKWNENNVGKEYLEFIQNKLYV